MTRRDAGIVEAKPGGTLSADYCQNVKCKTLDFSSDFSILTYYYERCRKLLLHILYMMLLVVVVNHTQFSVSIVEKFCAACDA